MTFLFILLEFFRHFAQINLKKCTNGTTKSRAKLVLYPALKCLAATAAEYVRVVIIATCEPANYDYCNNNPDPGINSVVIVTVAT